MDGRVGHLCQMPFIVLALALQQRMRTEPSLGGFLHICASALLSNKKETTFQLLTEVSVGSRDVDWFPLLIRDLTSDSVRRGRSRHNNLASLLAFLRSAHRCATEVGCPRKVAICCQPLRMPRSGRTFLAIAQIRCSVRPQGCHRSGS